MILVIKDNEVFATHTDDQDVLDKYPDSYDIIKVSDDVIEYPEPNYETIVDSEGVTKKISISGGLPYDPRLNGALYTDLRNTKTDLEILQETVDQLILDSLGGA